MFIVCLLPWFPRRRARRMRNNSPALSCRSSADKLHRCRNFTRLLDLYARFRKTVCATLEQGQDEATALVAIPITPEELCVMSHRTSLPFRRLPEFYLVTLGVHDPSEFSVLRVIGL